MRRKFFGILASVVLFALSACDSQVDQCDAPLLVERQIRDTTLTAGVDTFRLDLESARFFSNGSSVAGFTYASESFDEDIASTELWGQRRNVLAVIPHQPGTTEVRVRAEDACGGSAEQVVRGGCESRAEGV